MAISMKRTDAIDAITTAGVSNKNWRVADMPNPSSATSSCCLISLTNVRSIATTSVKTKIRSKITGARKNIYLNVPANPLPSATISPPFARLSSKPIKVRNPKTTVIHVKKNVFEIYVANLNILSDLLTGS